MARKKATATATEEGTEDMGDITLTDEGNKTAWKALVDIAPKLRRMSLNAWKMGKLEDLMMRRICGEFTDIDDNWIFDGVDVGNAVKCVPLKFWEIVHYVSWENDREASVEVMVEFGGMLWTANGTAVGNKVIVIDYD